MMKSKAPYDVALARAERGYQWLVNKGPLYDLDVNRIKVDGLNMAHPSACSVSQASSRSNYNHLSRAVQGWRPEFWVKYRWGVPNGFWLDLPVRSIFESTERYDRRGVTYTLLTQAWVEVITKHRQDNEPFPTYQVSEQTRRMAQFN
jgi:hypothetical protein